MEAYPNTTLVTPTLEQVNYQEVNYRKETFTRGVKVRLVRWFTPEPTVPSGTHGEVLMVDSMGTIHVKWENGSTLGAALEDFVEQAS